MIEITAALSGIFRSAEYLFALLSFSFAIAISILYFPAEGPDGLSYIP